MRAEEAKALNNAYAAHYQQRAKDQSPVPPSVPSSAVPPQPGQRHGHQLPPGALKPPVSLGVNPPPPTGLPVSVDMHKKEDSTQAR
jgi:hypothetical protein